MHFNSVKDRSWKRYSWTWEDLAWGKLNKNERITFQKTWKVNFVGEKGRNT